MRARYYSPDMRRFVNADIIHGFIDDSTSLNRYAYVNGNPVSYVDPFGLFAQEIFDDDGHAIDENKLGRPGSGGRGWPGHDPSISPGGSYSNYLIKNSTARYDASHGGYHYQGTNTSFSNLGQYYVPGVVSVHDNVEKPTVKELEPSTEPDNKHGNSGESTKLQHGYEIYEIGEKENVVKTGISGQSLNQDGSSPRANRQVNAFNREQNHDDYGNIIKYDARIVIKNVPGRNNILIWERENTERLAKAGNNMYKQKLPKWKHWTPNQN